MARATAATIVDRIDTLQRMLLEGSSNSACVAHASREWGVSRRQAYRLLKRAWQRIAEDVDATDLSRRELVAWCITQLMEAAGVAKQQKNPGSAGQTSGDRHPQPPQATHANGYQLSSSNS